MRGVIALTGATGFIGSALARRLIQEEWWVRALYRSPSPPLHLAGLSPEWVRGTLEDRDCLEALVGDADVVIHCAGALRGITAADFYQANVEAVSRLASIAASRNPAPRFLLISSLAAREPELSPYAASKRMGEVALSKVSDQLSWTALRPPAVYGPGDRALLPLLRLMLHGIAPIPGCKDARFSLLYVEDLAEAAVKWLTGEVREKRAFELDDGHPQGYTWHEVVETFERLRGRRMVYCQIPESILNLAAGLNKTAASVIGYSPMFTPGKVRELRHPDWVCDNGPFRRVVDWTPKVRLEEGLRLTLGL
ncbi:NAD-dependent epimerase/dehydratase [Candidatus Methylomirabilis lanthanidiphila]|uniref:NAD-dependent epimerase/dehydratase n=1 Tax=Candidatus Methylomirabilis lanthanidiphila TaxID=2211376 RepID=A0A564ZJ04_9BACT|nr:NAD(P)-dependent oxidoreductase [Candidatus Methylomirabilis lanthanidiphila]VUZ85319.1 NAD-dependent epimerase/dehydratase [Candidatus Methylomirabilis lanthanidiphila]